MDKELNEMCTKLLVMSQDPEVKEVYRKWAEQVRKFLYEK